jgi:hypothetical protein
MRRHQQPKDISLKPGRDAVARPLEAEERYSLCHELGEREMEKLEMIR